MKSEIDSTVARPSCADPVKCVEALEKEVTELKRCKEALENIASESSVQIGEMFFQAMVKQLAEILQADYTFIGHFHDQHHNRVKTIALCVDGQIADNIEYDLAGTPCANVVGQDVCVYSSHVVYKFPQDALLADMKVQGYVGVPLFDSQKKPLGLIVVLFRSPIVDVELAQAILQIYAVRTAAEIERLLTEKALKESEEKFSKFFETSPIWTSLTTLDEGVFLEVNQAFLEVTGWRKEEVTGRKATELGLWIDPAERQKVVSMLEKNKRMQNYPIQFRMKSGEIRNFLWSAEVLMFDGDRCMLNAMLDITDRKKTEGELRRSRERFRAIANYTHDWENWIAPNGKLIWVNPAVERITGYSREEYLKLPDNLSHRLKAVFLEKDREQVLTMLENGLRDQISGNDIPCRIRRRDGSIRWVSISYQPIYAAGGSFLGLRSSIRDITDRKLMEEALRRREKELSEKSRNLAQVNQALKAMLDNREVEKRSVEESMRANLKKLVIPYIEKMAVRRLDDESLTYLNVIKSNLEELVAPLSGSLSSKYKDLTPAEIKVVDLLRQGKTSKEIAALLGVSTSSVSFHRYNIRKKFGLLNKKTNLSAYLKTLSN